MAKHIREGAGNRSGRVRRPAIVDVPQADATIICGIEFNLKILSRMRMQAGGTYSVVMSLLFAATLFLCTGTGNAQVKVDTTQVGAKTLGETVVTAKFDRKTLRSATPTFSLDKERILRNGVTDISDAVHRLPGVTLRDYGGAGGMKTVSVRGLGSAHTAVVYDGMPLSDAQSGSIDLSRYSTDNLEQLSLIIGDNDDIFISAKAAASPATLSLSSPGMTLEGKKVELTSQIKAGSFGMVSPFVRSIVRVGSSVALGFTGEFLHAKNDYPFDLVNGTLVTREKRENNKMNSGHGELNFLWKTRRDGELTAKVYYYDNDRLLPGPVMLYNVSPNNGKLRDRNSFAQASFMQPLGEKWKLRAAAKFNWSGSLYTDIDLKYPGGCLNEFYWQREVYGTAQVMFEPTRAWSFDYSADYSFNSLNSNDQTTDVHPRRNSVLQSFTGKWRHGRVIVTGRLLQSLYLNSCREGFTPLVNHSRLSPSVSLNVRLLRSGFLYGRLSYKNIFRMPTFNEAFYNRYGNPYLRPETTDQFNAGLTWQAPASGLLQQLVVTGDVYRNYVHDRIVAIPQNMFIWNVTNLNSVHVTGADVTVNGTVSVTRRHDIVVSGTWSYQRAEINVPEDDPVHGCQVAYIPRNSGSASVAYENPWVNIVVHGRGTSDRYTANANSPQTLLPGYFEAGATLWRRFALGRGAAFEVRADLINMFDKQYSVIARYPMPGRSWMVTLKYIL